MSIEKLVEVLPPPEYPFENAPTMSWEQVEAQIDTLLPDDYRAFIDMYGSGVIGRFIYIWNPFTLSSYRNLFKAMRGRLSGLRNLRIEFRENLDTELIPYPIFPEPGGVLPFGSTIDGDDLFWLTQGDPNEWTIVIHEVRTTDYEEHAMSFTEFLTALLKDEIPETVFHESSFDPIYGFAPDSPDDSPGI